MDFLDMHPDMGLACNEYHALRRGANYWKGIFFKDAEHSQDLVQDGTLFRKVGYLKFFEGYISSRDDNEFVSSMQKY